MVQNLSGRIFSQEKVEFLKLDIWFQFYASLVSRKLKKNDLGALFFIILKISMDL